MGTNYYLKRDVCSCCGRGADKLHIGKSSFGWCFSLHIISEEGINDLPDWERIWGDPKTKIEDEYGDPLTPQEMHTVIADRTHSPKERTPYGYRSWAQFHEQNHSEPGPNHLLRHKVDGRHCTAHGEGTWDLLPGEFS